MTLNLIGFQGIYFFLCCLDSYLTDAIHSFEAQQLGVETQSANSAGNLYSLEGHIDQVKTIVMVVSFRVWRPSADDLIDEPTVISTRGAFSSLGFIIRHVTPGSYIVDAGISIGKLPERLIIKAHLPQPFVSSPSRWLFQGQLSGFLFFLQSFINLIEQPRPPNLTRPNSFAPEGSCAP